MKIGYDAKRAFQNMTGLGNNSRYVIRIMTEFFSSNQYLLFSPNKKKDFSYNIPNVSSHFPTKNTVKFIWRSFSIKKDLIIQKIDVYHGLSNEIPFGLKNSGIKTVVTIHDLIFLKHPSFYNFFDRVIYNFKAKYACKNADLIIAISEQTKKDIEGFYGINPEKIRVVYQNCNNSFLNLPKNNSSDIIKKYGIQKSYIVCVGTIEPRKNQLNIIKAFQDINSVDTDLVIIGRGKKYKIEVESYLKENKLSNVKILSNVGDEDLISLYSSSVFGVYMSVYEGFGLPIVEALSAGVPVLAASGSCLEEAGGDGCLYAKPQDISEISKKMAVLLKDQNLRLQLIAKGKLHITKFQDFKIADELNNIYLYVSTL